ncbi:MAG: hypothetical protein KHX11_20955, partial [Bacteroides cellulosilyticus]|nr:hypothetical protein [Bacteroides cellulosilyticus]
AIWKGIEEFGLTLLNTKHLLYLSKFCRFFASSLYLWWYNDRYFCMYRLAGMAGGAAESGRSDKE